MSAPSYLFVLCPPFSGSTILWRLICTSPQVSAFETEGQFLPEVAETMRVTPWRAKRPLPWPEIKAAWHAHWDASKPFLLEKSPPNLLRAREISEHFAPAYFLIMVRDPYAHCESLIRRNKMDARTAAKFSMRLLAVQAENARNLKESIAFTYEQLIDKTPEVCRKIEAFLPALGDLNPTSEALTASGDLVNSNATKIGSLSAEDVAAIREVLEANSETLRFWGYRLR